MRAPLTLAAAVLFGVAIGAAPADASCKRFGFTVNDYGKDGPTKDAKSLLDKRTTPGIAAAASILSGGHSLKPT